jgi:hypothetical protein
LVSNATFLPHFWSLEIATLPKLPTKKGEKIQEERLFTSQF